MNQILMEKQRIEDEMVKMKTDVRGYMESMQQQMMNQQQQQMQPNYPHYGEQIANYMQQPLPQDQVQSIAMVSNVFYNMLNMIGEQDKDKKIIGLSENLKKMVQ